MSVGTLVLLRHGESTWNAENLFTGWVDVPLSEKGEREARRGGQLLREAGVLPEILPGKGRPGSGDECNIDAAVRGRKQPAFAAQPARETCADHFDGTRHAIDDAEDFGHRIWLVARRYIAPESERELPFDCRHLRGHNRDAGGARVHVRLQQRAGAGLVCAQ